MASYLSHANHGPQTRVVLRNCGVIDPGSIEEYIAHDGYAALGKALTAMKPAGVIDEVKSSGLRGRGGAAFPTGLKWSLTAKAEADQKYIVCNADEGEPGTFKDRLLLEGDPHSIIEGMAIAGYAVGATKGFIYVRGEYRQSIERLTNAIEQARKLGFLGEGLCGTGFSFDAEIREGAGAYICGDETALIESLEGNRGEPRIKPPFPGVSGLWGKPTVVNNVETLANIAPIVANGAAWFRSMGTEESPGTKIFTLSGDLENPGAVELPFGRSLRELIYQAGQGLAGNRTLKMVQIGGSSGACLDANALDTALSYESLPKIGASLGSGAILVVDDRRCMVDMALTLARFFRHESCGKCTPCRIGTAQIHDSIERIASFEGSLNDLESLQKLGQVMQVASFCGLGQTAPVPVLSLLGLFRPEFETHIREKRCPTGVCSSRLKQRHAANTRPPSHDNLVRV